MISDGLGEWSEQKMSVVEKEVDDQRAQALKLMRVAKKAGKLTPEFVDAHGSDMIRAANEFDCDSTASVLHLLEAYFDELVDWLREHDPDAWHACVEEAFDDLLHRSDCGKRDMRDEKLD
jgi:hypothetical protein